MNNVVIIGGKTNFGKFMSDNLDGNILALGREDIDFYDNDNWLDLFENCLLAKFGSNVPDVIIINIYDRSNRQTAWCVQHNVLTVLIKLFSNFKTKIIVIGSMAHYYKCETSYEFSKRELAKTAIQFAIEADRHALSLVLIEPGSMENKKNLSSLYLTYQEVFDYLVFAIKSKSRFLQLTMRGSNINNSNM